MKCCGQSTGTSRRPRSSSTSASSLHANAAKFKPCKGIDKDAHKDAKATVQRIHAAEFAAKSALKLAQEQGSHTQQAAQDEFFHGVA